MNITLARKVLDQITEHPEQHDQVVYAEHRTSCGTAACIAGWTLILSGCQLDKYGRFTRPDGTVIRAADIEYEAHCLLDLPDAEFRGIGNGLFSPGLEDADAREWLADIIDAAEAKENDHG